MGCLGNVLVVCVWRRSQRAELVCWQAASGVLPLWGFRWGCSVLNLRRLVFPLWKRGAVWWRSWFVPFEYHLADCIRSASCTGASGVGTALCVTIIGIPFGLQQFKLAKLALMPFGAEVY